MNRSIRKRSHSIRQPLILFLLVISLVPLLGIGLFVLYRGITFARNQMIRQEQEYLEKTSIRLETCMQDVESYFSSASAQENLQKYYYQKLDYREYSSLMATQRMFRNFLEQQSLIDSVYYVSFEDNFFIGSQSADYFTDESEEILQEIIQQHNKTIFWENIPAWEGLLRSMKKSTVSISGLTMFIKCPMYNTSTGGAILVTISQSELEEMFLRVEDTGKVIIADDTGRIQFSNVSDWTGAKLEELGILDEADSKGKSGSTYIRLEDGNYYVNYLRGENDWLYVAVSSAKAIEAELQQMLCIYLAVGAGIVVILISMTVLLYKWLYTPIFRLTQKAGGLENGIRSDENEFSIIEAGVNSLISQKQMMEKQLSFFQNGMRELFLIKLIRGFLQEPEEIRKEGQQAGIEESYSAMTLLMFHLLHSEKKTREELMRLMEKIYTVLPLEQIIISTTFNGFWVIWIGGKSSVSELLQEMLEIQCRLEESIEEEILFRNSEIFTDFTQVRTSFYRTMASFAWQADREEGIQPLPERLYDHGFPEQLSEQLALAVKNGNLKEAEQILDRVLKVIFRKKKEPVLYQIYIIRLAACLLILTEEPDMESEKLYQILPQPLLEKLAEICDKYSAKNVFFQEMIVPIAERAAENRKKDMENLGERAIALIHREFSLDLTLEKCAQKLGCEPMHLWQVFREQNHVTFSQYLEDYRLQKTVERLMTTNASVKEIAEEFGYANSQNFIRSFKKKMGCTPGQYRENNS